MPEEKKMKQHNTEGEVVTFELLERTNEHGLECPRCGHSHNKDICTRLVSGNSAECGCCYMY